MKNLLLITVFCFSFLAIGTSQVSFGGGVTYLNDFGLQARASIEMDKIHIIPKFSYYFVDEFTVLGFDVDATYDIAMIADENPLYLFAGPTLSRASTQGFSNSELGANFGAGVKVSNIYAEIRYTLYFCDGCGGDIGFAAGYMF